MPAVVTTVIGACLLVGAAVSFALVGNRDPGQLIVLAVGAAVLGLGLHGLRVYGRAQRIATTGLPGRALVRGVTQTGVFLNENPRVVLDLEVTVDALGTFRVRHKDYVPLVLVGRLSDGSALPVRVDPHDRSRLVIDWNA